MGANVKSLVSLFVRSRFPGGAARLDGVHADVSRARQRPLIQPGIDPRTAGETLYQRHRSAPLRAGLARGQPDIVVMAMF